MPWSEQCVTDGCSWFPLRISTWLWPWQSWISANRPCITEIIVCKRAWLQRRTISGSRSCWNGSLVSVQWGHADMSLSEGCLLCMSWSRQFHLREFPIEFTSYLLDLTLDLAAGIALLKFSSVQVWWWLAYVHGVVLGFFFACWIIFAQQVFLSGLLSMLLFMEKKVLRVAAI